MKTVLGYFDHFYSTYLQPEKKSEQLGPISSSEANKILKFQMERGRKRRRRTTFGSDRPFSSVFDMQQLFLSHLSNYTA